MNKHIFTLNFLLFFGLVLNVQAQLPDVLNRFKKKLVDKVAETTGDKVIQKTSDKAGEAVDKALNNNTSSDKSKNTNSVFERLQNLTSDAIPANNYNFNQSFTETTTYDNGKHQNTSETILRVSSKQNYFGIETKISDGKENVANFSIMDLAQNVMFTFMNINGKKMRMAINLNNAAKRGSENNLNYKIEKTSEHKIIMGHVCDGYNFTSDKTLMKMWISQKNIPDLSSIMQNMAKVNDPKNRQHNEFLANSQIVDLLKTGKAMMGYTMDTQGTKVQMEITKINPNDDFSLNTTEYQNMLGK